jgi:superoxide reductase
MHKVKEETRMASFTDLIKSADWKKEKYVPVIECPDQVNADEFFEVAVTLGKEVSHPNTTEQHIRWITLYFQGEGENFPLQLGRFEFNAHGEHATGANKGPAYTNHHGVCSIKLSKSGTLFAAAYCNIHGLWESSKQIKVQ